MAAALILKVVEVIVQSVSVRVLLKVIVLTYKNLLLLRLRDVKRSVLSSLLLLLLLY